MRPNVEFRVELRKTNPGLEKSHIQQKTHGYVQKTAPYNYNKRSLFRHGQSNLRVDGHYAKLPTGRRMAKVAKVAYGWTVTTLIHLRVDTWPKLPTGG